MGCSVQLWMVFSTLFVASVVADITTAPSPQTVEKGNEVTFTCISGDTSDFIQWVNPQNEVIFDSSSDSVSDTEKYERIGTGTDYTIRVKTTDWNDAGPYSCETTGVGAENFEAHLVVMEQPEPYAPVIQEDKETTIRCRVDYASEYMTTLDPAHVPKMKSYIGDTEQVMVNETRTENGYCSAPGCAGTASRLQHEIIYKGNPSDNGKDLRCWAYTEDPSFELWGSEQMTVEFPPKEVAIIPNKGEYYVGEVINCTADGEPLPDMKFNPITSPGWTGQITGEGVAQLELVPGMEGDHVWECQAWNELIIDGSWITQEYSFTVIEDPDGGGGEGESSGGSDSNAAAIALGICIPIIIIAIIIIVVVLYRRRKKKKVPTATLR